MTEITVCLLQGLHTQNDTWEVVSVTVKCCSIMSPHIERPITVRYLDRTYTIPHATIIFALFGSLIPHTYQPLRTVMSEYILRVL
jgi:hypothetical protein